MMDIDVERVLSCKWCIVTCSKQKIWDIDKNAPPKVPARDAYTGQIFRLARRIAETFFRNRWVILSGKYGLIRPDTLIENYDTHISPDPHLIEKIRRQAREIGIESPVLVLAGTDYVRTLRIAFPEWDMYAPGEGKNIYGMIRTFNMLYQELLKYRTRQGQITRLFS